jgi:hypothetical protein
MLLANWIEDLFSTFSDSTLYFAMAVVGTALFSLRIVLMLFGGIDTDGGDFDMHADGIELHGGDFSLFSLFSILSFTMGMGWMGLTARLTWHFSTLPAALIAAGFGFALMLLSSFGLWQMRKMSQPTVWNPGGAVGMTGTVYMRIPAPHEGRGQVTVTFGGSRRTVAAVSTGDAIESFAAVRVVDVRDDGTLIVERI